jgi:hypothetical protein
MIEQLHFTWKVLGHYISNCYDVSRQQQTPQAYVMIMNINGVSELTNIILSTGLA